MNHMTIPTILSFPLWYGHISRRVAKKRLSRWNSAWMLSSPLCNVAVGNYIASCSSQHIKIVSMKPQYVAVGSKRRGFVLADVRIETEDGVCKLLTCGIESSQTM
jgi:hypothetical protein